MKRLCLAPVLATLIVGCSSDPADPPSVPAGAVYLDNFAEGVGFEFFAGSASDEGVLAQVVDEKYAGTTSLRLQVPASGWVGGTFKTSSGLDLSEFTAVTFWAKASQAATLDVAGLGVDNVNPENPYLAEWSAIPLTTSWAKYVVPIPDPAKLVAEGGLFHLAEGSDEGAYDIWLDDIRYETLGEDELGTPSAAIATATVLGAIGASWSVGGTTVSFPMTGTSQVIGAAPRYFDFASSDELVATVDSAGLVTAVGIGEAEITATLGGAAAQGVLTVQVTDQVGPLEPAPTPTFAPAQVISLFSDAYTGVPVASWSTDWDDATVDEVTAAGDPTKKYSDNGGESWGLFIGIEASPTIDASALTHFHFDLWTPDATTLNVKLVDFGPDGAYDTGDEHEHELAFGATTSPAVAQGAWTTFDLPLASFTGLTTTGHIAQIIFVATDGSTVYIDNVLFHD